MTDEKLLITKAQSGDPFAFEELIAMHQKNIFSIAFRIAGNHEDASDMAQEVLIKIFRNLEQFKGDSKFSTWLYRVATNTCLDMKKKILKHSSYSLDQELETDEGSMATEIQDNSPTPEQHAEQSEVQKAINTAISNLNDQHKKVIILRDVQGFSYEEIGDMLNCSVGTVKSRINRARAQLKKILSQNKELFEEYFV